MIRKYRNLAFALLGGLSFWGCSAQLENPAPNPGRADFSRTVAIGGHEMAGYQDGALYAEGQQNSIAALIARQLKTVGAGEFRQALVPGNYSLGLNPYPWFSPYQSKSQLGDAVDCEGTVSLGPVKDTLNESDFAATGVFDRVAGPIEDFSVPGASLWDWDNRNIGNDHTVLGPSTFAARMPFAGQNQSMLEAALASSPSFVIMWPGMQDVWNWTSRGGTGAALPSTAEFRAKLDSVLSAMQSLGAKGTLATIPDPSTMPYFTTIPPRALELSAGLADTLNNYYSGGGYNLNFVEGANGFVVRDPSSSQGIRQMTNEDLLLLNLPLDSVKCYLLGVLFQLIPDRCSLLEPELDLARTQIAQYNSTILDLGQQYDFAVADMAAYYAQVKAGIRVDAVDFNSEFASGGFFGLDGYGPNPKGAGLAANEFIKAINSHYGANVPLVEIHELRGVLFP